MRTTIELPDELLSKAKAAAEASDVTLKQYFISALELKLQPSERKTRRPPPVIGSLDGPRIGVLTAEQIDEALFG